MSSPPLLPFQPMSMTTAQLAAVSFLARYAGRSHDLYAYQLRPCSAGARAPGWTRFMGSSAPTSSSTSAPTARPVPWPRRPSR